jgi:hypothetical protein
VYNFTRNVDEFYISATLTQVDVDEFHYGLYWRRKEHGEVYFLVKDQPRQDLGPLARTLTVGGPDVEVRLANRIDKLEWIDASRVETAFILALSSQDGPAIRRIQGSNSTNKIDLSRDNVRSSVWTGGADDEIRMGPQGGEVSAGRGRNTIWGHWGCDEIIVRTPHESTCREHQDTNLTTVKHFQSGKDKIRLLFQTNGLVSDDVQRRIDHTLAALSPSTSVFEKYRAAKDVDGVEEGHIFRLRHGYHAYIGVDNEACTLIDLEPGAPFRPPEATDIVLV